MKSNGMCLLLLPLLLCYQSYASMPPPLKQVYTCPPSFVMLDQPSIEDEMEGRPGFKCYSFLEEQLPYQEADLECAKLNASLATPSGKEETIVISEYVIRNLSLNSRHYWINVDSNLTKENISPTAPSSGILGKIKESITRTTTTPSTSSSNGRTSCHNMLVWVVGRGDTRWIDEVCNKKAYPLCEADAMLEIDSIQSKRRRECSLQCSSHTMRIACELRLFPEAVNKTVVLFDPKCMARENRTHLIIHTALDDCGTLAQNSEQSKVVYKNALRILGSGENNMISSTEIMKISCRYPQNNFITKGVGPSKNEMQPGGDTNTSSEVLQSESTISDGSSFRHIFLIYKNAEYDCPIQPYEYPYTFHVDDRLYTEIRVIVPSEQIELHAVQCFVTETQEISSVRYSLLKNGCAEDKGFKVEDSPSLKIVRMSFDLEFIFTIFTEMYIHCEMMICAVNSPNSAKCQYECSKTKKRDVEQENAAAAAAAAGSSSSLIVTSNKILISNTTRRYTPDETKVPFIPEIREDLEPEPEAEATTEAAAAAEVTTTMTATTSRHGDDGSTQSLTTSAAAIGRDLMTTSDASTRMKKITGRSNDEETSSDAKPGAGKPVSAGQQLPNVPERGESSSEGDVRSTASGKPTAAAGMLIIVSLHYLAEGWN